MPVYPGVLGGPDYRKMMEGQIVQATKDAREMGQPVDDLIRRHPYLESRMKQSGESMMSFGRIMSMYVTGQIEAAGFSMNSSGS
jgi:hypothetical protein